MSDYVVPETLPDGDYQGTWNCRDVHFSIGDEKFLAKTSGDNLSKSESCVVVIRGGCVFAVPEECCDTIKVGPKYA